MFLNIGTLIHNFGVAGACELYPSIMITYFCRVERYHSNSHCATIHDYSQSERSIHKVDFTQWTIVKLSQHKVLQVSSV